MIGWLHSVLERLSPRARVVAIAAAGLVLLSIVASVLTPTSHPGPRTRGTRAEGASSSIATTAGTPWHPSPVSAAELLRVRQAASRFLKSYLPFAYGRASARSVNAVAPSLRGQLTGERAQFAPVERRRHPRVVSLEAVGQAPGLALATAMIDDGGITTYPLRLRLERGPHGWAVSAVDGG
jgi:hypothetical protein